MANGLPVIDRDTLQRCIRELGVAIASGECTPLIVELEALAEICDDARLPAEAARVRRWMNLMAVPEVARG
jgi:hypothetical protein